MGYIEAQRWEKTGSTEAPAEKKDMGSWTALVYSAEQQERLGIDQDGNRVPAISHAKEEIEGEAGVPPANPLPHGGAGEGAAQDEEAHDLMVNTLWIKVEAERQMQRLAAAHFGFWHFYFLFIPAASLTMASGILAFLSTSEAVDAERRVALATVVGCLSLVAVFLQTINDQLKYGSRAEMHRSAVLDLKRITDELDFMQIDRIGGSARKKVSVATYHGLFSQVQQGCKSMLPLRVSQAFNAIDTRIMIQLPSNRDVGLEGTIRTNEVYIILWNELYCAIAAYWLFPLALPDPDRTIARVLERMRGMLMSDLGDAAAGARAQAAAAGRPNLNIGDLLLIREKLLDPVAGGTAGRSVGNRTRAQVTPSSCTSTTAGN